MKKILAALAVLALAGGMTSPVWAEESVHGQDEERVEHYKGQAIETAEAAIKALRDNNAKIAALLASEEFGAVEMEDIHEISYTLETSIDKLIKERAGTPDKLGSIDEAVQAVHYASEKQEEEELRAWFAKLEEAVATLDADSAAQQHEAATHKDGVYELTIKDHRFTPEEIRVPAGQKIKLVVHNQDSTPEEFESDDFRREKIIAGNSSATIFVGPLEPGKYHFFGEFNLDTANGYLIAE
jgi:plastocyanin